ncbi:hypothetical protein PENNAL_c0011G05205 [Penicillium nalgiovense]|uniref:Uncharacterized protein n=1 Tax=Penicillium nalgiovense TaxID=60175 RepID=A0A1V6YTN9_PENNA|nr:hypothetical protein PENNAL_c0011G05205 [Penicillium nalgiovense]
MSSNKGSSNFLTAKTHGTTSKGTTSFSQNVASQTSVFASNSESQKRSSYTLAAWAGAPVSSEPWSSTKAAYFPTR